MRGNFGRELTIGVEEELLLLDAATLAPVPAVESLLGPEGLKPELFACLIETNTRVCGSAAAVLAELVRLRRAVAQAAEPRSVVVAAAGSHPFAVPEEQALVGAKRYAKMLDEVGPKLRRQLVCGLHVHIGMKSFETCSRTLSAITPWLPSVLALSLNSPYLAGEETGMLSARAGRLLELPRMGAPPYFASADDWEAAIGATGLDYTRSGWDARPHPRLGTLEVRICDQPTGVARAAALAALVQALCVAAPEAPPMSREAYLSRRAAAAAGRVSTEELLALVEPVARALGSWEQVQVLRQPGEALRQLETGRRDGIAAVVSELVELTAA